MTFGQGVRFLESPRLTIEQPTITTRINEPEWEGSKNPMTLRFITKTVHSYIDYPVALSLMTLPFVLGVGMANPLARWLSVGTGFAALLLTLLTDHATGVFRVLPYSLHVAVDRLVGITFLAAPFALGFTGLDAAYYWLNAAAVLAVTFLLNAPEPTRSTVRA